MTALSTLAQTVIHVPQDQPTIQAGIDAANAGDTVLVSPGTYLEGIDFKGKAITVTSVAGAAATIIDASAVRHPAATFQKGEARSSVLNGFTLRGGGSGGAGALGSGLVGGIYIGASSPTISNNVITGSHCYGIDSQGSSPLIQGNEIDNTLDGIPVDGCSFAGGAAVWLSGSLSYYNGGVQDNLLPAVVFGNTIQNNTQSGRDDAGGNGGVGVAVWGADALIESNIIRNNATLGEAAILSTNTDLVSIIGNLIYGNSASGGTAGIALLPPGQTVGPFIGILANNTIVNNTVSNLQYQQRLSASQVRLDGNLAQYVLINNIIVGSTPQLPALSCSEIYGYLSVTPVVLDHNDVYNPGGAAWGSTCQGTTTYGNLSGDPLFVNVAGGDFHLQQGSPALDAGNTSAPSQLTVDIAGASRLQDATGRGYPVIDMGAYEAPGTTAQNVTVLTLTPSTYYESSFFTTAPPLTLTASLTAGSAPPGGPVTFYIDGNAVATQAVDRNGNTSIAPSLLPGLHAFVATYPGQGGAAPAVSVKFYLLVPKDTPSLSLVSSANPSAAGSPVTFTVQGSSPDGIVPTPVVLSDRQTGTPLATLTLDAAGKASYTTSALTIGTHYLQATFPGSATDNTVSALLTQAVVDAAATNTTVSSSLNPAAALQPVTFTARVTAAVGTPTGSIAFEDGTLRLATVAIASDGTASYSTALLAASGSPHLIMAQYVPSNAYRASQATLNQYVLGLPSATTLTVTPGSGSSVDTYTMTASVAGNSASPQGRTPSGTVTFHFSGYDSAPTDAVLINGIATLKASQLSPGQNLVSAVYPGDSIFAASTSAPVAVTVQGTPTVLFLSSSANPALASASVTITAHLLDAAGTPAPAGAVVLLRVNTGQAISALTDGTGTASFPLNQSVPGTYALAASFAGKNNLLPSTASLVETLTGTPTMTALNVQPSPAYQGQTITLTGTVSAQGSSLGGETLSFYDGVTLLGTVSLSSAGTATLTTSTFAVGLHSLTAVFTGDQILLASTSPTVGESVLPSSFGITLSPAAMTLTAGKGGTAAVTLNSIGAFAGPLVLSMGALPTYMSAAFDTAMVSIAPGVSGNTTIRIATSADPGPVAHLRPAGTPATGSSRPVALLAALMLPALLRRRNRALRCCAAMLGTLLLQTCVACTDIRIPFHTVQPGTYHIPITATDSLQRQQSAELTLTVTP